MPPTNIICARENASNIDFPPRQIQEHYPTMNNIIALNIKTLNALIALNMSAEKLSSPRGDLELLLCGRLAPSKEEEAQVSS